MIPIHRISAILSMLLLVCSVPAYADENDPAAVIPMRLSYADGSVSFWRYGAPDWVDARLNTPLAAGDSLYVGDDGDLELQIDSRSFVRADDDTQLTLVNQTPDFLQLKVATGRVSFDLRALPAGNSVEVDTPNAVFNIDHAGYYRVDVDGDVHFITRRGGRATIVPAGGLAMSINPSEEIVVSGTTVAQAVTYAAPLIDSWDRWNYDRTEDLLDAVSDRYLPYGIAGASDLDQYGSWRVVPDYGPIWVPDDVSSDWAPYSTGNWTWDPYYEWTWIDDAPWGWAPFHYGRWVYLDGYWGWAPGPVTRRPVYAPALVAFFNIGPGVSPDISAGYSSDGMGWVALGWGEPLTPWWGRPGFIGKPWWGGWGGPHMVNSRMVRDDTFVDMHRISYENARFNHAVVATTRERFGHGEVQDNRMHVRQIRDWVGIHGALPLKAGPENLVAGGRQGVRPPESVLSRPVVATRPQQQPTLPWRGQAQVQQRASPQEQRFILVPGQTSRQTTGELPRPAYGGQTGAELPRPAFPPRFPERHRDTATGNTSPEHAGRTQPSAERGITPPSMTPQRSMRQSAPQLSAQPQEGADLPGNPANRVYRDDRSSGESFQNNGDNPGFGRQRSR